MPQLCQCEGNQLAKQLEVKKEGKNKGKKFWACAKPQGEQCQFFSWDDETINIRPKPASGEGLKMVMDKLEEILTEVKSLK